MTVVQECSLVHPRWRWTAHVWNTVSLVEVPNSLGRITILAVVLLEEDHAVL
jgi:hypothetical protein